MTISIRVGELRMCVNGLVVAAILGMANGPLSQDSSTSANGNGVVTVAVPEFVSRLLARRAIDAWHSLMQTELPLEVALYRDVISKLQASEWNQGRKGRAFQTIHVTEVLSYAREMAPVSKHLHTTLRGIARDDDPGFVVRGVGPDRYTIVRTIGDGKESSVELVICVQGGLTGERSLSVIRQRFLYDAKSGRWNGIDDATAEKSIR